MFAEIFSVLAPVLIATALGFYWAKIGQPFDTAMITPVVTYVGTPCLVFYALAGVDLDFDTIWDMGMSAILANIAFVIIGAIFLFIFKLPQRAFLQALSFPNIGNVGLPICLLAFGEKGLALAISFFAVYVVLQLTIGVAFLAGSFSFKSLIEIPIIPATVFASFFLFTDFSVPLWLHNTTKLIGDMTIPLMLFALGVTLASLKVVNMKTAIGLSVLRLGMGFGVGLGLAWIFDLDDVAAGVIILQCSMPAAVFCYLFAQHYNQRPQEVASMVIVSNFLGFASLPALLWFVLQ